MEWMDKATNKPKPNTPKKLQTKEKTHNHKTKKGTDTPYPITTTREPIN